nr:hypothetical protein CFF04554_0674 [Campylobacter fetus subsp. fetus 04/554]
MKYEKSFYLQQLKHFENELYNCKSFNRTQTIKRNIFRLKKTLNMLKVF